MKRCFLFSEHGGDLAFGRAVNPRVSPALLPAVQIGLRFFEAFEAKPFQWRLLRVPNARFDFALSIRILNAARHGDGAIVRENVAVQRIQGWIVDVGLEHAFPQIVEHDNPRGSA